ncbi:Uncharacterized membrane protein YfhO [Pilibacter termitis]|uniref:Uncharacterized membrane protein YfhO n=1 Tax=Pilibacter termitis TaxID=263852 RepID=A0A1T4K1Z0_9ENTE|nr:YfhO family protein [Pilibacter termitis]SJZ36403.1 Uncharacterized membrane protein YfhO [Pilibacter termitis]
MISKKNNIKFWIKENGLFAFLSFFIPLSVLFFVYLSIGIYWGSTRTVLASDAFAQFSNFHASFNNMLHGKQGLLYSWNTSLGLNYLSLVSYYLGGIFTPLVFFFKNENIPDALYFITLLKVGASGFSFWLLAKNLVNKLSRWGILLMSLPYPLMSFAMSQSELIMWLDAYVWLPLVVLGIHRILNGKHTTLLFFSYFLLFLTNFYFGYMIGIFTFLLYLVKLFGNFKEYKKTILPYLRSTILAILSSTILTLPVFLDLKENGEKLSKISTFKTEATQFWDIVAKNFIASYDGTKYGSVPFVYIGILPLLLAIFYFLSKKVNFKEKIGFFLILSLFIASFYIEWLNLAWQGFHSPNMFLFRFAFLFSFLILYLAVQAFDKLSQTEFPKWLGVILVTCAIFGLVYATAKESYSYLSVQIVIVTFLFFVLYFLAFAGFEYLKMSTKKMFFVLLCLVTIEGFINTSGMINGILDDWNYASRGLYATPHLPIQTLVDRAEKDRKEFSRLENLDSISPNDNLNFGYSGISFFSSIRNRHSSHFMDTLGFRSEGTNLNIRYDNNTILMDSLFGIEYNIAKSNVRKFGFHSLSQSGEYKLFKNEYSLPLGFLTNEEIYKVKPMPTDNLYNQKTLFNTLSGMDQNYFSFATLNVDKMDNTTVKNNKNGTVTYSEKIGDVAKKIYFSAEIPADKQAYISLFATNHSEIGSSTAELKIEEASAKSQIDITGQYYNIGYAEKTKKVHFSIEFYGSPNVTVVEPKLLLVDVPAFTSAVEQIKADAATTKIGNESAEMTLTATEEKNILYTTIPYDKGWQVTIDGKKASIRKAQNAFLSVKVPSGKHTVKFTFLPNGMRFGGVLFVVGMILFFLTEYRKKISEILLSHKKKEDSSS